MEIKGCVAVITNPQGRVIASANDFEKQGYGGFTLQEAQRIRCKDKVKLEVVKAYSSPDLYNNLEGFTFEKICDNLLSNGFEIHFEYIGHDDNDDN